MARKDQAAGQSRGGKTVSLALQGGGAHGAFSWGVLDRLLEEDRLTVEAVASTSGGAMTAVVMAAGLAKGGRTGARAALDRFWHEVSRAASWSPTRRTPVDLLTGGWSLDHSPGFVLFDLVSRMVSPYEVNPFAINPLRDLLLRNVDFAAVRACTDVKLFVNATNVRTGRPRVFRNGEINADVVLAAGCLPFLFKAVEIDGEDYWDGAFTGNPSLFPLVEDCAAEDIVLVQVGPIQRQETPKSARDILNRVNEIAFNDALLRDVRALDQIGRLLDRDALPSQEFRRMRVHRIHAEEDLRPLSVSSKMNAEWAFLKHLHDVGYRAADEWLTHNFSALGVRSTDDLEALSQDSHAGHRGGQFL